ncbi:uncharacterized protein LOC116425428 [Nomia melanderi]|uniref:uncharacterized protein LOC116425428 n=1 Tax=Nomia melanderi TaxID=2448451 RepID=UPI0013046098|nr:uncharacterized protein LOC116425428 [Nomia melanderi]
MKEEMHMFTVLKISIFLLILNNVYCQMQLYEQSRRPYYYYRSLDKQPSVPRNNDSEARTPLRIAWGWPFNQQNRKKDDTDVLPNDKFIYPDDVFDKPKLGPAPSCNGQTFCEDVPDYPTYLINDAFKNQKITPYQSVDQIDLTFRLNDFTGESLCISTEQVIYPKSAENVNNQWLYIVNHPNYTQGVRIETCRKMGEGCRLIEGFAEGYTTSCEQKYIHRELAAIVKDGSISRELFRFPASCCCHVQFVGTSLRMREDRSIENLQP